MLQQSVRANTLHVISLLEKGTVEGERLATLTGCCQRVGMSFSQFHSACRADAQLLKMYKIALAMSEDIMVDAMINIDEHYSDAKMAHVVSRNIQWVMSRRRRLDYGDHVTIEHTTTRDQELLKRLKEAQERTIGIQPSMMLLDGEIEEAEVVIAGELPLAEPLSVPAQPDGLQAFPPVDQSLPAQQAALRALLG